MIRCHRVILLLVAFVHVLQATIPYHTIQLLNQVEYPLPGNYIIQKNEWQELQLDVLLEKFNYTVTEFGSWGIYRFLIPVDSVETINHRQRIVQFLVMHDHARIELYQHLQKIRSAQKELLSYWHQPDELAPRLNSLYFSSPLFSKRVKKYLNSSRLALGSSILLELSSIVSALLQVQILSSIYNHAAHCLFGDEQFSEFDIIKAIQDGLQEPLHMHNIRTKVFDKNREYTRGLWVRHYYHGTLGDRYHLLLKGYRGALNMVLRTPEWTKKITPDCMSRFLRKVLPTGKVNIPLQSATLAPTIGGKITAACIALFQTAYYDYRMLTVMQNVESRIRALRKTLRLTVKHMNAIADLFEGIHDLAIYMQKYECFAATYANEKLSSFVNSDTLSSSAQRCVQLICTSRNRLFPYGHMLLARRLLEQNKDELIPFLQAVGECDAYFSLATLYKKYEHSEYPLSFVQFEYTEQPFITFKNNWCPLLVGQVQTMHSTCFGKDSAKKQLLTGPNGCGKSTYIKALGQSIVLAHSWGLVPASVAHMSPVSSLRTCFAPLENIVQGFSQFMAEDKRMLDVEQHIQEAIANNHYVALIDEPWRGTEGAVAGEYIYQLGMRIAENPYIIALITTHVRRPIELEVDTKGLFKNMQVVIQETDDGFERMFAVQDGPAWWWFDDSEKRMRFVTWLKKMYSTHNGFLLKK